MKSLLSLKLCFTFNLKVKLDLVYAQQRTPSGHPEPIPDQAALLARTLASLELGLAFATQKPFETNFKPLRGYRNGRSGEYRLTSLAQPKAEQAITNRRFVRA